MTGLVPAPAPRRLQREPERVDERGARTVGDVMTRQVTQLAPQQSLRSAIAALRRDGVSGSPVVLADGTVIGVLSESDIVGALNQAWMSTRPLALLDLLVPDSTSTRPEILEDLRARLGRMTVAQAMTRSPAVVEEGASLAQAARLMKERSVNRLPVLREGHLVGVIGRRDLIGAWPSDSQ